MLEKLETIDWSTLKHAYGAATDVPALIRDLASPEEETRDHALQSLYGNIFHQGSRYTATPQAIPFLYELLEQEGLEDKNQLMILLVHLALGYPEEYLPEGFNPEQNRKQLSEWEAEMIAEGKGQEDEYGHSYVALLNCYEFTQKGLPILLQCLQSQEINTINGALYALAWFPEAAAYTFPEIVQVLTTTNKETILIHALLALGLLAKQSKEELDLSPVQYYLGSDSKLIRVCAAIALANTPMQQEVLDILVESIKKGEQFNYVEYILFNEGRVTGYISTTLSTYGSSEQEKVIPALCQVLASVNSYQALDITYAILSILTSTRTTLFIEDKLEQLSSLELQALDSIYEHGGWKIGTSIFGNYSGLLSSMGVPDSKEKLGTFLCKNKDQ